MDTISQLRRELYQWARLLGDVQAIAKGPDKLLMRLLRKQVLKTVGPTINRTLR